MVAFPQDDTQVWSMSKWARGRSREHWKEDLILGTTNIIYKKQRDKPDYGYILETAKIQYDWNGR